MRKEVPVAESPISAHATEAVAEAHAKKTKTAKTEKISIERHSISGILWFAGWLFTIGFLHLPFWKGVLALLVWPYYLGSAFAPPASTVARHGHDPHSSRGG
jgi:hypothetical protein